MSRLISKSLCVACALAISGSAFAQDMLIRNAKVHTATSRGTLENADVLVRNGRISAVGQGLQAGSATVVDAGGRALTPACRIASGPPQALIRPSVIS